jgi:hypothetical protein
VNRRWCWVCALLFVTACTQEEADRFFLTLILWTFGAIASVGALTGASFALVAAFQQKARGFVNLGIALPCAVAAVVLDAVAVSYSHGSPGVDREDYFVMMMTATPLCWLGTAIAGVLVRPPGIQIAQPMVPTGFDAYGNAMYRPVPPVVVPNPSYRASPLVVTLAIMLPLLVCTAYYVCLYFVLPPHVALHV